MLRKLVYTKIEPLLTRCARFFAERNFTPNQLTFIGSSFNLFAGWAYSGGLFALGGALVLVGAVGDLLDGPLARLTGKTSGFGAFLDSTVDRYSDFFLFGGVTFYYATEREWGWCLAGLGILLGASLTSYTKARAENLIPSCSVGLFERTERIVLLLAGSFFPPLLPWVLGILLVGTHATALERILFVRRSLSKTAGA